jgi:hypothetical protein
MENVEDNFRKTVGQALGGIAVLVSAWLAYRGTQETLQANQEQSRLSQQASHDLLVSNQVAKGFDQTGGADTGQAVSAAPGPSLSAQDRNVTLRAK